RNIDLRAADITAVDGSFGRFDYIVCHGVYSWVPGPVREKILDVCAGNLNPDGVAYVSYNTYPGWHARGIVREMLSYHVRRATSTEAADRIGRARDFLGEVGRVLANPSSAYGVIVRTEAGFLQEVANSYLYHEHLEETNHPFYFWEFMREAEARGL